MSKLNSLWVIGAALLFLLQLCFHPTEPGINYSMLLSGSSVRQKWTAALMLGDARKTPGLLLGAAFSVLSIPILFAFALRDTHPAEGAPAFLRLIRLLLLTAAALTDLSFQRIPSSLLLSALLIRLAAASSAGPGELMIKGAGLRTHIAAEAGQSIWPYWIFTCCLLGLLTLRGMFGGGDFKLVLVSSFFTGPAESFFTLIFAFLMTWPAAVLIMAKYRGSERPRLCFAPFLLAGALFCAVLI